MTHPSLKRNMVPKAVLMMSGLVSLTTTKPVNTAQPRTTVNNARSMTNIFNKAHSTVRRPINNKTTTKNSNFNKKVNTVSGKNVNIARPKAVVDTAKPKALLNAIKGNHINAIKTSACWIQVSDGLGPQKRLIFLPHMQGNPQMDLKDQGVIDSGCSRHMIGNMSYLTDFEEIDGGYIAFGGLQVKQKEDGIFISQDKYVTMILKKFGFTDVKTASIPIYLKGQPKLGIWYPKDSSFDLVAYTDSDFARASLDRKSTTRGCQFLGSRLISWQCKKQTVVVNSTTEAEYVAASSCCGQMLWI
ncbi:hypothetical protein Tco_0732521 [Tanacetum coccineum]